MTPTVNSDEQNKPGGSVVRNRSHFDLNQTKFDTYRFGEVKPVFVLDGVPNDKNIRLRSGHDARSLTMSSILMENVNMHKAHFAVPMEAILPLNWNKWFENPVIGEDVPDDAGCGVKAFRAKWARFCTSILDAIAGSSKVADALANGLYFLKYASYVYSDGSLLASLDVHMSDALVINNPDGIGIDDNVGQEINFDQYMDIVFNALVSAKISMRCTIGSSANVYWVCAPSELPTIPTVYSQFNKAITWRDFFYNYFDEVITISDVRRDGVTIADSATDTIVNIFTLNEGDDSSFNFITSTNDDLDIPLNLSRLWAYQLVCAHFFTNDKVDYVFSAELFRQLIGGYVVPYSGALNFTVNGIDYLYDFLSACFFNEIITGPFYSPEIFSYFNALFDYRHSLKFMDYFTGSRTRPLAVGDVTVSTVGGSVNVVDLAQTSWRAKFLQSINRFGNKARNYIEGVFGVTQAYDYHDPKFLGKTTDVIYSSETENTGADQYDKASSVTSVFRSNGDRFAFDIDLDRNTILISVVYFDVKRAYPAFVDRNVFVLDRNDMFNPFAQYFGDQQIYQSELSAKNNMTPMSYTNRDMQYKIKVDVANGGFIKYLPGWSFLADKDSVTALTPRYIRSQTSELDRFFLQLSNDSPAGYFHFIVKNQNICSASRPMAFNPIIGF